MGPRAAKKTMLARQVLEELHHGGRVSKKTQLAVDDAVVIGTLIVGWDGWRCHLYRMAVEPSRRRHGVATLLLAAAQVRARRAGMSRLYAMVSDSNDIGVAFWEAAGFRRDAIDDRRWSQPVETTAEGG